MRVKRLRRIRIGQAAISGLVMSALGLLASLALAEGATAEDCPGHPDALGTSRTLVVDPRAHPRIGAMQYQQTLPLHDHEVVLTFDDGPLPRNSNQVLQILADQCVKAIFFTIGQQAKANPDGVRKLVSAGHTVATHTESHPLGFARMGIEKAQPEIDQGIAATTAALSDPSALAPFFRFPGLERSEVAENYLASRGIQVWSADFLADDWRHISSAKVYELAMKRLEARGRGILLLHDIQARTVAALPNILHELKARGYRIVQVVPATAGRIATATEPQEWQVHPISESVPIAHWPKVPELEVAGTVTLPAPTPSDLGALDGELPADAPFAPARHAAHSVPIPRGAPWPRELGLLPQNAEIALPVPGASLFEIAEKVHAPIEALPLVARRSERASSAAPEQVSPQKSRSTPTAMSRRSRGRHAGRSAHQRSHLARTERSASEHETSGMVTEKPKVRVASLKTSLKKR